MCILKAFKVNLVNFFKKYQFISPPSVGKDIYLNAPDGFQFYYNLRSLIWWVKISISLSSIIYSPLLAASYPRPYCRRFKIGIETEQREGKKKKKDREKKGQWKWKWRVMWDKIEQLEWSVTFTQHWFSSVLRTVHVLHILQLWQTPPHTYPSPLPLAFSPLKGGAALTYILPSFLLSIGTRKEKKIGNGQLYDLW